MNEGYKGYICRLCRLYFPHKKTDPQVSHNVNTGGFWLGEDFSSSAPPPGGGEHQVGRCGEHVFGWSRAW